MRAISIQQHGPIADLKVSEVPTPPVPPGGVLVKVEASGINPSDVASVEGRFPQAVLPRIVGRDFAVSGAAGAVGQAAVRLAHAKGARIVALIGALKPPVIGERYPLAEAASAYGRVVAGGAGKVVFVMTS